MKQAFLRKWHRWLGFPAAVFLLVASITGAWLAGQEFFGADEALREQTRDSISPVDLQTPDAELALLLAQSRSAVAVHYGGAAVEKILWQFKGNQPTITYFLDKPNGEPDYKVTVDAHTGAILSADSFADKSFILRLHSGEALGDGGLVLAMLWGLTLALLTVSGVWIYLQMRRPDPKGLRRVFWLFVAGGTSLLTASRARADSPFYTDDPNFSPGWEIKLGWTAEHNASGYVATGVLDWNYAIVPNVRLNLTTYAKDIWPSSGGCEFGYGDTECKIKWRFQDEDSGSGSPALGIAPKVFIPTADDDRGLGDGVWRFQLPLQMGKTVGSWYHFAEVGYQWAFDDAVSDSAYAGAGTLYSFTSHFALGTELFGNIPVAQRQDGQLITTLGAVYTFNDHFQLKASVSSTLRDPEHGGPNPSSVFYMVWNF